MGIFPRSLIKNGSVRGALGGVSARAMGTGRVPSWHIELKQEALKGWKGKQALEIQIRFP